MSKYNDIGFFSRQLTKPVAVEIVDIEYTGYGLAFQFTSCDIEFALVQTSRGDSKVYKTLTAVYSDIKKVYPYGMSQVPVYITRSNLRKAVNEGALSNNFDHFIY
jgi:hypothetical protein